MTGGGRTRAESVGWSAARFLRGWLSVCTLQLLGMVVLAYRDPRTLASHIAPSATPSTVRAYAAAALLQILMRLAVLLDFDNVSLHFLLLLASLAGLLSCTSELYFFRTMPVTMANLASLALYTLTLLLWLVCWRSWRGEKKGEAEEKRPPRRLFAKHYMEGNLLGVGELEKRKKAL